MAWSAPQKRTVTATQSSLQGMDFVGIKMGDVNGSWRSALAPSSNQTFAATTYRRLRLGGGTVDQGGVARVPLWLDGAGPLTSLQLSLRWDAQKFRFQGLADSTLPGFGPGNLGTNHSGQGMLSLSWDPPSGVGHLAPPGKPCLDLRFEAVGIPGTQVSMAFAQTPAAIEVTENFVEVPVLTQDVLWQIGGTQVSGLRLVIRPLSEDRQIRLEIGSGQSLPVFLECSTNLVNWQVYRDLELVGGKPTALDVPKAEMDGPKFWRARQR